MGVGVDWSGEDDNVDGVVGGRGLFFRNMLDNTLNAVVPISCQLEAGCVAEWEETGAERPSTV
jgi:hypothetical protein